MTGLINYKGFSLDDTPSLEGRVCVITGGQAGIGKEITAQLLLHCISLVYVLARSSLNSNQQRGFGQNLIN
jgi:NAD(P)-dependent dehydrogenase (short-subunit alcohol dehydrogenase family)